jgi:G6PDH family F420-dependent oxidoreductase
VKSVEVGLLLSSEEYTPHELVDQAMRAERAGFHGLSISDHFHPWLAAQGQSSFVWTMIGAISQVSPLPICTFVVCPIMRVHPVILAQAAATSAVLTGGKFILGVGTGEALNESIMGEAWPPAPIRRDMLREAVALMRELWRGEVVTHEGDFYTVHHARIYTRPENPPPVYLSGLGSKSTKLAGRIADGFISSEPSADAVASFRAQGGAGKPTVGGAKACFDTDEQQAIRVAYARWRTSGLPGELGQVLPTPEHFEQGSKLVPPDAIAEQIACGPDPKRHLDQIEQYRQAGFDEIYVAPVGPKYAEMIEFYRTEILPQVAS